jgi:DNA-3-methyladenine glycosylase
MNLLERNFPNLKSLTVVPPKFYSSPSKQVARELLGKFILRFIDGEDPLLARIVETEAYEGANDPASHAYRGVTDRTRPMFEQGGVAYVYFTYGMHHCLNVVTGEKGQGEAVLLRAAEPLIGQQVMYLNRGLASSKKPKQLLSGPGKLCQALDVDLDLNFHKLGHPPLQIMELKKGAKVEAIAATPRIGISKAKELPYRFCIKDSDCLSRRLAPSGT